MTFFSDTITNIHFDPLLPTGWLVTLVAVALLLLVVQLIQARFRRFPFWRVVCLIGLCLALLNPSLLQKQQKPIKDVAVLLIDESPSQDMGQRKERTEKAARALQNTIPTLDNMDLRVVRAPAAGSLVTETRLFDALDRTLADIPKNRRAGVVIISDGQVHDVPTNTSQIQEYGPVHVLLSGNKQDIDRRIDITQAPAYGIVGDQVEVRYKIEQTQGIRGEYARVTLNRFDGSPRILDVPVGEEQTLTLPIEHAGENIFELSVETVANEITDANNRAAIRINGVRDRLRVLLVSGKPHAGGRTWRDLLTSDPGVDLVHFTILREPEKIDSTPQRELSLIPFPFRELFEIKLYDFDLVIFDRYTVNRILPQHYYDNITTYVKRGGALLEASDPSFLGERSIFETSIGTILPAAPKDTVLNYAFTPHLSTLGKHHPVTQGLAGKNPDAPDWGRWLRQVDLNARSGDVLMTGYQDNPLLILDRVEQGRVAQIGSDHIWLWSRGFDGGGPHSELLRRIVHWLMKEPELDERALKIDVDDRDITLTSLDMKASELPLTMIKPDGSSEDIVLSRNSDNILSTQISADMLGIYAFTQNHDGDIQRRFAIIGEESPRELRDVLTTAEKLTPVSAATHGGVVWLEDYAAAPRVRTLSKTDHYAGQNWIGLRNNHAATTFSVKSHPVFSPWEWLLILTILIGITWWREGQQ